MHPVEQKKRTLVERWQVLIVALAFGAMVCSSYFIVKMIVRGESKHNAEQSLTIMQADINSDLTTQKMILEVFSQTLRSMILRGNDADMIQECINELTGYILSAGGNIQDFRGVFGYFETLPGGAVFINGTQQVSSNEFIPLDNVWYREAVEAEGNIVQTLLYADINSNKGTFTYSRCLFDDEGRRLGVAGLEVSLDTIVKNVMYAGLDYDGYGMLLNEKLDIISHPYKSLVGKPLYQADVNLSVHTDALLRGKNISELRFRDYRNRDVIVFFRQLSCGWHLGIVVPYARYYQNANRVLWTLVILGVVLGAALSAMLLYISSKKKLSDVRNQQKSNFLATMSHEIRTPMNVILGITEIQLQDEGLAQDMREAFSKIHNSGDLLLGIINDILDLSKIEAGKMELVSTKYEVASLINDIVQLNRLRFESKPIEFNLEVDENIPAVLVGDELRIKQILNNLLSNAFKYTNQGGVLLSATVEIPKGGVTAHVMLVFRVKDTGQGMSAEQVQKLFDEYSRFNLEANRATEGTGLGMSIMRNLINMMDGKILVESEPGAGSLFTIRLKQGTIGAPLLGKEGAEKLRQFRSDYQMTTKILPIVRKQIPFGKVLIVDDMDINLYVAEEMLLPYGLQIDKASSGSEAIEKIKRSHYNLVFMDHMMPLMDGIETAREIRKLGQEYEKLPIVALTANAISGVKEMFLANGFNGFISKPIQIQELDNILNEWIPAEETPAEEN